MKKLLLILFCLPLLFSCGEGMKEKLPDGDTDIFLYETYEFRELFEALDSVNTYLKSITVLDEKSYTNEKAEESTLLNDILENEDLSEDLSFEEFANENPLYALLYPNVNQQSGQLNTGPVVGFCAIKDTKTLNTYLNDEAIKQFFPIDVKFTYTAKAYDPDEKFLPLLALRLNKEIQGYDIADARHEFSQYTNSPEISISLSQDGTKKWEKLTAKNIGRSIAIVVDGFVYSYPTVQSEISGGRFSITGNFTVNESKELVKKIYNRKIYF